ncbi:MAG TPA: hypothetical protein VIK84_07740 [Haloplasmataceae bacterium]
MLKVRYIYDIDNQPINEYTLKNGRYQISALNLGATITKIIVPNKLNKLENITLRYHDYKLYQNNLNLLGCLINMNKFLNNEICVINDYFKCNVTENCLYFSNENTCITYTLKENMLIISWESNNIYLGQSLFFNFSGNVKDHILSHNVYINENKIDLHEEINFYKTPNIKNSNIDIKIQYPENGINVDIVTNNNDIYYTFGKHFNKMFKINKGILAEIYSGLGVIFAKDKDNEIIYHFN